MAKVFKSKIFLGIICLILAAAIAFLVLPNFYASKSVTTHAVKLAEMCLSALSSLTACSFRWKLGPMVFPAAQ